MHTLITCVVESIDMEPGAADAIEHRHIALRIEANDSTTLLIPLAADFSAFRD